MAHVGRAVGDAERIDQIRALEELKSAAAAAQAVLSVDLDTSQRGAHATSRIPSARQGRGVGAQIALARRESPVRGARHLGAAKALVNEMPHSFTALRKGLLSEWRATLLVRETACLSVEHRQEVDQLLAADAGRVEGWGDRRLVGEVRKIAARLDALALTRRARRAVADRRVSCRPAPDTMSYVSALMPVTQGVAVYAALSRQADTLRAAGDPRGRGQIMADTLFERVTGLAAATGAPVEVKLVITDRSLFRGDGEPAYLPGYGTVPAGWARDLVQGALTQTHLWLRALYTHPMIGDLVAMSSHRRLAPSGLADFVDTRDQTCRTPWCDAPIRHRDHVVAADAGGMTVEQNLQGLCEQCNHAKQAPGWRARPRPGPRHVVVTHTPTGHRYRSIAPPMPGTERSSAERYLSDLVLAT